MNQLIHTPAGVRDIFGEEYERKRFLMERIGKLFSSYGYQYSKDQCWSIQVGLKYIFN